jgi:hypothetical protein
MRRAQLPIAPALGGKGLGEFAVLGEHLATGKMRTKRYVDVASRGTEFSAGRRGIAMFGAFHENQYDHCNHYVARNEDRSLAYVSTIPFLMKSFILEETINHVSVDKSVELLYPVEAVEIFEAYFDRAPAYAIRVPCAEAIWSCTYSVDGVRAGTGTFGIYPRDGRAREAIISQVFEWDLSGS